ncbi:hypothetical protein GCM10010168_53020 [Actinoplanes ianthinogenes]|uniref:PE family protein n=1 Tax=Actinoplanes ianthinogenes TaxID=122358 RepID=A0ABM7LQX8_9ACTN|nr:hypothetical protein [Actinoplanes ianthinogenes]BCJ41700.1 hypothetical protein Aiant_23570 [Actinoplanes ianthinogenes]GGR28324.1 hypothetical protein GCM10010168_53020 [Actinoplanes ianthinogenes]
MSTDVDLFPATEAPDLPSLLRAVQMELKELGTIIPIATEAQWTAAPVARPREDTTERASGSISDPTGDAATCAKRLKVRDQLVRSEHVLQRVHRALEDVRRGLGSAVDTWTGEVLDD